MPHSLCKVLLDTFSLQSELILQLYHNKLEISLLCFDQADLFAWNQTLDSCLLLPLPHSLEQRSSLSQKMRLEHLKLKQPCLLHPKLPGEPNLSWSQLALWGTARFACCLSHPTCMHAAWTGGRRLWTYVMCIKDIVGMMGGNGVIHTTKGQRAWQKGVWQALNWNPLMKFFETTDIYRMLLWDALPILSIERMLSEMPWSYLHRAAAGCRNLWHKIWTTTKKKCFSFCEDSRIQRFRATFEPCPRGFWGFYRNIPLLHVYFVK